MLAVVLATATLGQGVVLMLLGRLEWRLALEVLAVTAAIAGLVHQAWVHRLRLNHRIDMLLVMGAFGGLGMLAGWWVDLGFAAPPRDAGFHAAMGHGCADHATQMNTVVGSAEETCCDPPEAPPEDPSCCDDEALGDAGGGAGHDPSSPSADTTHAGHSGSGGGSFWPMAFSWMTGLMLLGAIPPGILFTRCAELARTSRRRWVSTHIIGNGLMIVGMIWLGHWIGPILADWTGSAVLGGHIGMLVGMLVGMEAGMFGGEAVFGLQPWRELTWRAATASHATPPTV
jgi:hypothetical protein